MSYQTTTTTKSQLENILLVDDTPDNLRLLSAILTEKGYVVRKALSGQLALKACQKSVPDLILLDINMPEMNGYEVCQMLKKSAMTCDIPVIFISALDDALDKVKAFEFGGIDYITKPFQEAEVLARIGNHLKLRSLQINLQEKNIALQQEIQARRTAQENLELSETLLRNQKQQIEHTLNELKKAQTQLIQTEKMVALGQLVAGIAHEINNPINFINGNLTYANEYFQDLTTLLSAYQKEYPNPSPEIQNIAKDIDLNFLLKDLQNIIDAMYRGANRIQEIVLSLRNFSRLDEAEMKAVDIHQGIDSTLLMLQHRLEKKDKHLAIKVMREYAQLPKVTCYASQINQVFLHLLNNAIDAIEEDDKFAVTGHAIPTIRICTQMVDSNTVSIRIADNGPGIDEANRSRLFDPFFTTKPVGSGRGLGLSISYQIVVQQHQGQINCSSSPGQGAEFTIVIPVNQPSRY